MAAAVAGETGTETVTEAAGAADAEGGAVATAIAEVSETAAALVGEAGEATVRYRSLLHTG